MWVKRTIQTVGLGLFLATLLSGAARADKLAWVDNVLRGVVRQAREEAGVAARPIQESLLRSADDLDGLARQTDSWGRMGTQAAEESTSAEARFARLVGDDPQALRNFRNLSGSEQRLVTRISEASRMVALRYPNQADTMIRGLGPDGLMAVRAYGDDVAQVIVREGPESIDVLRKTGRPGWRFYTDFVLQNKQKLAAAGVLSLFLANPDQFIDSAGRITEYAVEQFAKAGIDLAGAMGQGAARGLDRAVGTWLHRFGWNSSPARLFATVVVGLLAVGSLLVVLGLPIRLMLRPILWPLQILRRLAGPSRASS